MRALLQTACDAIEFGIVSYDNQTCIARYSSVESKCMVVIKEPCEVLAWLGARRFFVIDRDTCEQCYGLATDVDNPNYISTNIVIVIVIFVFVTVCLYTYIFTRALRRNPPAQIQGLECVIRSPSIDGRILTCPICMDQVSEASRYSGPCACAVVYCKACLIEWLQHDVCCPLCRRSASTV
jgi:hypothetical protein